LCTPNIGNNNKILLLKGKRVFLWKKCGGFGISVVENKLINLVATHSIMFLVLK